MGHVADPGEHASIERAGVFTITLGVAFAVLAPLVAWQLAVVGSWAVADAVLLVVIWPGLLASDGEQTNASAAVKDETRLLGAVILIGSAVASLGGVGFALHKAARLAGFERVVLTVAAVLTVALSWLLVNTVYTLRYAHLYYVPPVGGIDFPGTEQPDYRDFAYLAFTIGMTYQVSDTGLRAPPFRRVLLSHALLSYLFGTVIVATSINVVAGFVGSG